MKELYRAGAKLVTVDVHFDERFRVREEGGHYADTLIVCGKSKKLAKAIADLAPDERGRAPGAKSCTRIWWD